MNIQSYRVLIKGKVFGWVPVSNTMSHKDALRFAKEWQEQFPDEPVLIAPSSKPIAYEYK